MPTEVSEVRTEIECKLLCLAPILQCCLQNLLEFSSQKSDIALNRQVGTPGESLSAVLQHHSDITFKIKDLNHKDNKTKFFSNGRVLRSNIDIDKIDVTVSHKILTKIPAYPTCVKSYHPLHPEQILHSDESVCVNDMVCCSLCLRCKDCFDSCDFSEIKVKELVELRNISSHNTFSELKDISDALENQPCSPLAVEWKQKLENWRDIIVLILNCLCEAKFLSPSVCELYESKVNNVITFKKDVYLPCCFPKEEIHTLLYRKVYEHKINISFEVLTDECKKLAAARYQTSEASIILRKNIKSESKKMLLDAFKLNEPVDINLNRLNVQNLKSEGADVIAKFRISSKEKDVIPKDYEDSTSTAALCIMQAFECIVATELSKTFSNLKVQCIDYEFASINMYFLISGARTRTERNLIKAELDSIAKRNKFDDLLNKCNLNRCEMKLTFPFDVEQNVLEAEFQIVCYTENAYQRTDEQKPLIKQILEENCKNIFHNYAEDFQNSQLIPKTTKQHVLDQRCMVSYLTNRKFIGGAVKGRQFCERLLANTDLVEEIFKDPIRYEQPVLECLRIFISQCDHQCTFNVLKLINDKLEGFNETPVESENLKKSPFHIEMDFDKKGGQFELDFEDRRSFIPVFNEICNLACREARYIAHFLLKFDDIDRIFMNYQIGIQERLLQVLECWRINTSTENRTWNRLKALLIFLKKHHVVKLIERSNDKDFIKMIRTITKSKEYSDDTQVETSKRWSIMQSFGKAKELSLKTKEIIDRIITEVKENLEWYQKTFKGDLIGIVKDYGTAGTTGKEEDGKLILSALANVFEQSIDILKIDENDFLKKEVVFPDRTKQSYGTIRLFADEKQYFYSLFADKLKKRDIEVLCKEDTYFILEVPDIYVFDAIILKEFDIGDEQKVQTTNIYADTFHTVKIGEYTYILVHHNMTKSKRYQCLIEILSRSSEFPDWSLACDIISSKFSLHENDIERRMSKHYEIISHKQDSKSFELEVVDDAFFKEEIYCSALVLSASRWIRHCENYIEHYLFTQDHDYSTRWAIIPHIYFFKTKTQEVANLLRNALLSICPPACGGVIFLNYDSKEHLKFLTKDNRVDTNRRFNNRILIFHEELCAILNIRVTEKTQHREIMKECFSSSRDADDVAIVVDFLSKHEHFKYPRIKIASFVAAPNLPAKNLDTKVFGKQSLICSGCADRILTGAEFSPADNYRSLQKYLESLPYVLQYNKNDHILQPHCHTFIRKVVAQIVGFMAYFDNIHEQLIHLLANDEQIQAIVDPQKHKVIKASFGCGKSLVATQLLSHLVAKAHNQTMLFYVSLDPFSFVDYTMMEYFKALQLRYVVSGLINLRITNVLELAAEMGKCGSVSVSEILQHLQVIAMREGRTYHVVVDEICAERMTDTEVVSINEALRTMKEHFVTFCFHPCIQARTNKLTRGFWKNQVREPESFDLKLEMSVFKLPKLMQKRYERIQRMFEVCKQLVQFDRPTVYSFPPIDKSLAQTLEEDHLTQKSSRCWWVDEEWLSYYVLFVTNFKEMKKKVESLDTKNCTQVKLFQLVICLQSVERGDLIICHERETLNLVQFALDVIDKKYLLYVHSSKGTVPTLTEKKEVADAIENSRQIVVTDCNGCRGLQTKKVIIPLRSKETFLRYSVFENAANATKVLFIIMDISKIGIFTPSSSLVSVIKMWISEKLVRKYETDLEKIDLTDLFSRLPSESQLVKDFASRS